MVSLLRFFSLADGLSFIVLIYFAIYEKRILGDDEAIRIPGMVHGGIFTVFFLLLMFVSYLREWPLKKTGFIFICALVPFAPLWADHILKREGSRSQP